MPALAVTPGIRVVSPLRDLHGDDLAGRVPVDSLPHLNIKSRQPATPHGAIDVPVEVFDSRVVRWEWRSEGTCKLVPVECPCSSRKTKTEEEGSAGRG